MSVDGQRINYLVAAAQGLRGEKWDVSGALPVLFQWDAGKPAPIDGSTAISIAQVVAAAMDLECHCGHSLGAHEPPGDCHGRPDQPCNCDRFNLDSSR